VKRPYAPCESVDQSHGTTCFKAFFDDLHDKGGYKHLNFANPDMPTQEELVGVGRNCATHPMKAELKLSCMIAYMVSHTKIANPQMQSYSNPRDWCTHVYPSLNTRSFADSAAVSRGKVALMAGDQAQAITGDETRDRKMHLQMCMIGTLVDVRWDSAEHAMGACDKLKSLQWDTETEKKEAYMICLQGIGAAHGGGVNDFSLHRDNSTLLAWTVTRQFFSDAVLPP